MNANRQTAWTYLVIGICGLFLTLYSAVKVGIDKPMVRSYELTPERKMVILSSKMNSLPGAVKASSPDTATTTTKDAITIEQLLVTEGINIGLPKHDRSLRNLIATSVIDDIVSKSMEQTINEKQLVRFYQQHAAMFTTPRRLQLGHYIFPGNDDGFTAANDFVTTVRSGITPNLAALRFGASAGIVPATLLNMRTLRNYLPPHLVQLVINMGPDEVSEPMQVATNYEVFVMIIFEPEYLTNYSQAKDLVKAKYLHRQREKALQNFFISALSKSNIKLAPAFLETWGKSKYAGYENSLKSKNTTGNNKYERSNF